MGNRDVRWLQRYTNIADLMDDGIENYSDLRNAPGPIDGKEADDRVARASTPAGDARTGWDAERAGRERSPRVSLAGVLAGTAMASCGAVLAFRPVDMLVYHQRTRSLPSFIEHVTRERSVVYGIAAVVLGLALAAFSAWRPHR